jgi:hypothetical protein
MIGRLNYTIGMMINFMKTDKEIIEFFCLNSFPDLQAVIEDVEGSLNVIRRIMMSAYRTFALNNGVDNRYMKTIDYKKLHIHECSKLLLESYALIVKAKQILIEDYEI